MRLLKKKKTGILPTLSVAVAIAALAGAVCTGFLFSGGRAAAACAASAATYGTTTTSVNVPADGTYRIWSRLMAPDATNNSYSLEIDGGTCYTVGDTGLVANQWGWVDYQAGTAGSKVSLKLTTGKHTFKLIGREPGVKVDRVMAVLDGTCSTGPTGVGDNCTVETDATAPVVTITTPAETTGTSPTVSGTVNAAATATDAKGVTKVDFYIDNIFKASDMTSPYGYTWDTTTLANGTHNITAKAYDAVGNVGLDTNTVTIRNGDAVVPTAPTNVTATASGSNKVTVVWKASTDNVGVTGYSVLRNGVIVATAVSGTQYIDAAAIPETSYVYKVTAYDAAGNVSTATSSNAVSTPKAQDTTAPSKPTNVAAEVKSTSQINLKWTASTDNVAVAGYDVYRSVVGGNPTKIATVGPASTSSTTLSYGDANLTASTRYSYYVIARDANANVSPLSDVVSATTLSPPVVTPPSTTPDPTPTTPPPPAEPAKTGTIRGKVTGGKKDKSLAGARVTMTADGKRYTATTNRSGVYRFDNLPAGRYVIHYHASGHESGDETLRLKEGKKIIWNMWLVKKGESSHWWDR